ncbi:MAG TPA: NrfD/PsrC family molybdoenzyme membrane anchor subunit [Deferrisomatales bacterium]|nr:NrfD/PsrC family molybdoenzyme membrane anchor subunit [Deferrisomatales bacterium]
MGHSPQWGMEIVWYFFLGGIAAGAYFVAALADLLGDDGDRPVVRAGYLLALPLALALPILLTLDLGTPGRAFNMFLRFELQSPMSVGSWALLGFGLFAAASAALILFEERLHWAPGVRKQVGLVGALLGFFIASYTGVLLGTTNRPFWGGSNLLGALFLASAASTGVAAIALWLLSRGSLGSRLWERLRTLDEVVLVLEVVILAGFLGLLGDASAPVISGRFAPAFWAFLVLGLGVPFALQFGMTFFRAKVPASRGVIALSAVLLLLGGFVLRYLVVVAGQA